MHIRKGRAYRWLLALIGGLLLLALPGLVLAVNLLGSGGTFETFESFNGENWRGYPEEKGQGWTVTVLEEDGLHFLNSDNFGRFLTQYYGVPYLNYRLEGSYAQSFASRRAFNFVFSRTVTVDSGQDYALGGKIVSFWKGPDNERDNTKIFKRIGIDPTGGTSHTGPSVVWTAWEGLDNAWTSPALALTAQTTRTTVFIQVENIGSDVGEAYLNTGYIDNFRFERAPVATLNLPTHTSSGPLTVTWSVHIPDPSYWTLWGYDVEYTDDLGASWQSLQTHDSNNGENTSYSFNAQAGLYTFRVRPWQERPGGDAATTSLPGLWEEKSVIVGQGVTGQVTNHLGLGLGGVTVSATGGYSTVSQPDGQYWLGTETGTFLISAANANNLQAPPPVTETVTADAFTPLSIVLYPTGEDQALSNNHFETGLTGWNISDSSDVTASVAAARTGLRGLSITNSGQISQTNSVTEMRNPTLSFWYKSDASFNVEILAETSGAGSIQPQAIGPARTESLPEVDDWTFVVLELNGPEFYSGEIGVNFATSGGSIQIDEVSLAIGARKAYLPTIFKN